MQVECPRCGTRIEKPASGSPVCPSCGYGSEEGAPPTGAQEMPAGAAASSGQAPPADPTAPGGYAPQAGAPPGGYGGQPGFGGPPPGRPQGQEQGLAITSLILGIASCFIFPFIASIAAIITAVIAKKKIKEDPARYGGEGMATTGLVLGIVSLVLYAIVFIFFFGAVLVAVGYCEENPDDPDCQDDGFMIGGASAMGIDQPPAPAWSWLAVPLTAVQPHGHPVF